MIIENLTFVNGQPRIKATGFEHEEKPLGYAEGSEFYCNDTNKLYIFISGEWKLQTNAGGGSSIENVEIYQWNPREQFVFHFKAFPRVISFSRVLTEADFVDVDGRKEVNGFMGGTFHIPEPGYHPSAACFGWNGDDVIPYLDEDSAGIKMEDIINPQYFMTQDIVEATILLESDFYAPEACRLAHDDYFLIGYGPSIMQFSVEYDNVYHHDYYHENMIMLCMNKNYDAQIFYGISASSENIPVESNWIMTVTY